MSSGTYTPHPGTLPDKALKHIDLVCLATTLRAQVEASIKGGEA